MMADLQGAELRHRGNPGAMYVEVRSPTYLRTRLVDRFDTGLAERFICSLEDGMGNRSSLRAFHDCSQLEDYDVEARERVTAWSRSHLGRFDTIHLLVQGRSIAWGLRVISMVVGSKLVAHHDRAGFEAACALLVSWVNAVSVVELEGVLDFLINPMARDNLLANRPFASARAIADTAGVGVDTFRALRNAGVLRGPFEELASDVTELNRDVVVLRYFDWLDVATEGYHYQLNGLTCFGVDPTLLVNGATIRPNLADGAEVLAEVSGAVSFANRYHELTVDPTIGLANLATRVGGGSFFGCYIGFAPDPWSGVNRAFFVDTETGFSVLTETRWSE
jgi:hypothetical protein